MIARWFVLVTCFLLFCPARLGYSDQVEALPDKVFQGLFQPPVFTKTNSEVMIAVVAGKTTPIFAVRGQDDNEWVRCYREEVVLVAPGTDMTCRNDTPAEVNDITINVQSEITHEKSPDEKDSTVIKSLASSGKPLGEVEKDSSMKVTFEVVNSNDSTKNKTLTITFAPAPEATYTQVVSAITPLGEGKITAGIVQPQWEITDNLRLGPAAGTGADGQKSFFGLAVTHRLYIGPRYLDYSAKHRAGIAIDLSLGNRTAKLGDGLPGADWFFGIGVSLRLKAL